MLPEPTTVEVRVVGIDESVTIRKMTARAFLDFTEMCDAEKPQIEIAAQVCHHCVVGWSEHSVDDILNKVDAESVTALLQEVLKLQNGDSGNSETDHSEDSS